MNPGPPLGILVLLVLGGTTGGCTSDPVPAPPAAVVVEPTARPIASVDGRRMNLQEIEAALLEFGGATVVRERALDRAVAREAAQRGIEVDEAAIARERRLLVENLSPDPDRAELLLVELRRARGLGPLRFAGLLRRNALLRALVSEDVVLDERTVRGAWDAVHGPARTIRIIATSDLRSAESARSRIEKGEDFTLVAIDSSIDASGPRGGRLAPISRLDPSWPEALRTAIFEQPPGELSEATPLNGRILIFEVLEERPGDGVAFDDARAEAERVTRLAAERLLMDRLARRLVAEDSIEPLDPSLRWSLDDQVRR